MSVKCRIKMKDGYSFRINYVCFGLLRQLSALGASYFLGCTKVSAGKRVDITTEEFRAQHPRVHLGNIKHIDFLIKENDGGVEMKVIKDLFDGLPMFKGCISVHPRLEVVRATPKNLPADQVVLGLMAARNATYYQNKMTYAWARKEGANPLVSFLFADWYVIHKNAMGNESFIPNHDSESQITDPATLGTEGVSLFLNQDKSYKPWIQKPFKKGGYRRDTDYEDDDVVFNDEAPYPEEDDYGDVINDDDLEESGYSRFYKMVSCFSDVPYKEGDTPIEGIHANRPVFGAFRRLDPSNSDIQRASEVLSKLIKIAGG